jgi:hypothetical protein
MASFNAFDAEVNNNDLFVVLGCSDANLRCCRKG